MSHYDEYEGRPELLKKKERAEFITNVFKYAFVAFCVITLTIVTVNAIISFQTRNQLIDCTDPQGDCYRSGQQNSSQIIQELLHRNVLIGLCTNKPDIKTPDQAEQCVARMVKEEGQ